MTLPLIDGLHHVALEVRDLEAALLFYCGIIGLREIPVPHDVLQQGIRWLELPEGRMLHLIKTDGADRQERAHVALSVPDVSLWREYLIAKGVELVAPKVSLYVAERLFIRDPSGNLLELVRWG
jgi:catechol 2,3-dioxygenase-like lactoylglutathione lyase family enzyme